MSLAVLRFHGSAEKNTSDNRKKQKWKLIEISRVDGCQVPFKDKNPEKVIQSPLVWHKTDELKVNS